MRRSLNFTINLVILLVVALNLVGFGAYRVLRERDALNDELETALVEIAARLTSTLIMPVWNLDVATVAAYVESEMLDRRIAAVIVTDLVAEQVIVSKVRNRNWQVVDGEYGADAAKHARQFVVGFYGERLAQVDVYLTSHFVHLRIREIIINRVVEMVFLLLVIMVALVLAIMIGVVRPVRDLMAVFESVAGGNLDRAIDVSRQDELGSLARSFAEVRDSVRDTIEVLSMEIEDRRKVEEALRQSEEQYRALVNNIPGAVFRADSSDIWRLSMVSDVIETITGYTPAELCVGRAYHDVVHADDRERVCWAIVDSIKRAVPYVVEYRVLHRDGEIRRVYEKGQAVGDSLVYGAIFDITERKRLEDMMVQNEKMMSVGGLAAGMAHEINNPLAGILQNVQVIRRRTEVDMPQNRKVAEECGTSMEAIACYIERRGLQKMFGLVVEASQRAAKVVDNMLSFSRKSKGEIVSQSLADLLDRTVELVSNDYDLKRKYDFRQIEIVREYADLPPVPCEGSKIQQVILNLLKNGAQAMAGHVESPRFVLRLLSDDGMARLEVEDNGPGMSDEVRRRIFEPFFTTKGEGVGTGLGLSVSYFIVTEDHLGEMEVDSRPGRGTVFIVRLPFKRDDLATGSES